MRSVIDEAAVASLLSGRLVIWLDGGPPESYGVAYEFEHEGATYHYGLAGSGFAAGWVAAGPFVRSQRSSWSGQPLDLHDFLVGSEKASFSFADLLPQPDRPVAWDIKVHPSGPHLLLSQELARTLGIPSEPQTILSLAVVLQHALREKIVISENLRRPPRSVYQLSEVGEPVVLDDAGDLPLALYRRLVGQTREERHAYLSVQKLFSELTGGTFGISAKLVESRSTEPSRFALEQSNTGMVPSLEFREVAANPAYELELQLVVPVNGGQVPIELAGAGVWETLVACFLAVDVPGQVVLLDEPAANLHPVWQRRLLAHLAELNQVVLVTHSPFLVPDDLSTVTRLAAASGQTRGSRLRRSAVTAQGRPRWRQLLSSSADVRSALFARGVVLLEGDTELGALGYWFGSPVVVGHARRSHGALNLQLLAVGSDRSFRAYVSYLEVFGIPWAIICDGPVLSPQRGNSSLLGQLRGAGVKLDSTLAAGDSFAVSREYWQKHGAFTLASCFGLGDDEQKGGEIEAFFEAMDPRLWEEVQRCHPKSKARAGYAFAEQVTLEDHQDHLLKLRALWEGVCANICSSEPLT